MEKQEKGTSLLLFLPSFPVSEYGKACHRTSQALSLNAKYGKTLQRTTHPPPPQKTSFFFKAFSTSQMSLARHSPHDHCCLCTHSIPSHLLTPVLSLRLPLPLLPPLRAEHPLERPDPLPVLHVPRVELLPVEGGVGGRWWVAAVGYRGIAHPAGSGKKKDAICRVGKFGILPKASFRDGFFLKPLYYIVQPRISCSKVSFHACALPHHQSTRHYNMLTSSPSSSSSKILYAVGGQRKHQTGTRDVNFGGEGGFNTKKELLPFRFLLPFFQLFVPSTVPYY